MKLVRIQIIVIFFKYKNIPSKALLLKFFSTKAYQDYIDIYNNILALTSTVVNKGSSSQFSIFMLFGYANGTDSFIDTPEYFMEDYINSSKNTASKLFENIIIENNIFGYELINDKIILSSIPNEILFYNKTNENIKLENEDFLDINYILKQNEQIIKYDKYYSLDYQLLFKNQIMKLLMIIQRI